MADKIQNNKNKRNRSQHQSEMTGLEEERKNIL